MSKKLGRPKTPKSKAKTNFRGAFFDTKEAKTIDEAAAQSGQDKSKWLRKAALDAAVPERERVALLNAARPVWLICDKWGAADLHGKTVEFSITTPDTKSTAEGLGRFWVIEDRDKVKLAIEIHGGNTLRLFLIQETANCIEKHANSAVAEFSCFARVAVFQRKD